MLFKFNTHLFAHKNVCKGQRCIEKEVTVQSESPLFVLHYYIYFGFELQELHD